VGTGCFCATGYPHRHAFYGLQWHIDGDSLRPDFRLSPPDVSVRRSLSNLICFVHFVAVFMPVSENYLPRDERITPQIHFVAKPIAPQARTATLASYGALLRGAHPKGSPRSVRCLGCRKEDVSLKCSSEILTDLVHIKQRKTIQSLRSTSVPRWCGT